MKSLPQLIFFLIISSSFLIFNSPTRAQSSTLGLTAIPPRLDDITVEPGQTITKAIKIRNESQEPRFITTTVKDIIVTDSSGTPLTVTEVDNNRWSASSWIQVSPTKFRLDPGETLGLTVTILAPEDALPGGHYAAILHAPDNQTILNQSGSTIEANVGTLVYITIPGPITQDARVTRFDLPRFSEFGPINIKSTIKNLSDIHIAPAGAINISNLFGAKTASLKLNSVNIFPGTSRDFENSLNKKWLLGRYKAQLNAAYGTAGGLLLATAYFWVIPYRLLLLLTLIIIILILLFLLLKKRPQQLTVNSASRDLNSDTSKLSALKRKYQDRP